ncbi:uncharacterized protein LOC111832392 [Capsella rubella]|uniref:uncharacterized protein LOC111832392 n=1 Tax=Capsella rubella TaxID=81985 RepID=UPI000CD4B729|nr:uncharacterized protein LOC111832392 [Capsella rubella]
MAVENAIAGLHEDEAFLDEIAAAEDGRKNETEVKGRVTEDQTNSVTNQESDQFPFEEDGWIEDMSNDENVEENDVYPEDKPLVVGVDLNEDGVLNGHVPPSAFGQPGVSTWTDAHGYYGSNQAGGSRRVNLEHTCSIETRNDYLKKATSKVIAAVYKSKFSDPTKGPAPLDLQQMVLEDLRVSASYSKCWRAKGKAEEDLFANPGTITYTKTEFEDDGSERFLYLFLAFGASIQGFRNLRRGLVVDGTRLTEKFKGVLLTVSGQDANFQVFPLAFVVVDSENDESWMWFFERLERIIADSKTLSIISDRNGSIYTAKKRVFPLLHHGACIVHLARNVNAKFHNKVLAKLVVKFAFAHKVTAYKETYNLIKAKNNNCAIYFDKIGAAHWTRSYFQGDRYNLMTSNIAESLNKALGKARASPIVELLKFMSAMLTRWFSARRKKAARHIGITTSEIDKVMIKALLTVKGSKTGMVSSWSYEVVGMLNEKHHVLLDHKQCTCKQYDRFKIPCGHALLAANSQGIPFSSLVGDFYTTEVWRATYKEVINPELCDIEVPEALVKHVLYPPKARRPFGRPPKLRIPSIGEIKKQKVNRCGRCICICGFNNNK